MDFGKILVRNIPKPIFDALVLLAGKRDRSTEAEARQAIQAWVAPALVSEDGRTRMRVVAQRLSELLTQVNADRGRQKIQASHLAQGIGEERVQHVEDWLLGLQEPTLSQLAAVADLFGVNVPWLQHGDGAIYPASEVRLPEAATEAVDWMTQWEGAGCSTGDALSKLHIIRERTDGGHLIIVKSSKQGRFQLHWTNIKVSDDVGVGGRGALQSFFVALELLYKRYTRGGLGLSIASYQMSYDDARALLKGNTNPNLLIERAEGSVWWEDIWDAQQYGKREYWPGWSELCVATDRGIEQTSYLAERRLKIRSGEIK